MNSDIVDFYRNNKLQKFKYSLKDILDFSYQDFFDPNVINLIFPDVSNLSNEEIDIFKNDITIRKNIIKCFLVAINFFGIKITQTNEVVYSGQSKALYNKKSYDIISNMIIFFKKINLNQLTNYLLLGICKAVKSDKNLADKLFSLNIPYKLIELRYKKDILGLSNYNNSCYADSILVPLLLSENKTVEKFLFDNNDNDKQFLKDIKNEFKIIRKNLLNNLEYNLKNLKEIFNEYSSELKPFQSFQSSQMNDPSEFLYFIFKIFNFEKTIEIHKKITEYNMHENTYVENYTNVFEDCIILLDLIQGAKNLNDLLSYPLIDDLSDDENRKVPYTHRYTYKNIISGDFIVFHIKRLKDRYAFDNTEIIFPEVLKLNQDKLQLNLYAIITYENRHYTAYINIDKCWYFYNDLVEGFKFIGLFENIDNYSPGCFTNGLLYLYKI
jgi:hypothetical protein